MAQLLHDFPIYNKTNRRGGFTLSSRATNTGNLSYVNETAADAVHRPE
jgi:hypothetical protein